MLNQGEPFEKLAQTYSDDPGSARAGGDLGWVSPGQMVPLFEEKMGTAAYAKAWVKGKELDFETAVQLLKNALTGQEHGMT